MRTYSSHKLLVHVKNRKIFWQTLKVNVSCNVRNDIKHISTDSIALLFGSDFLCLCHIYKTLKLLCATQGLFADSVDQN